MTCNCNLISLIYNFFLIGKQGIFFLRCSSILSLYIRLIYVGCINFNLWETWVSKIWTSVVNFYLGKDVQLNCSALLNEKDVIYWNIWKKNGKDPNVHEEEGTRIRYEYVIYVIHIMIYKNHIVSYIYEIKTPDSWMADRMLEMSLTYNLHIL